MLSQRSIGLRTLALFWQVVAVTLSFWGWLFVWENAVFEENVSFPRYLLYNEFLLVGLVFGSGGKKNGQESVHQFVEANRKSVRQAALGLFCVLLTIFALHDQLASRSFFFSYVPWLYLTLLFSNYALPQTLGKWAFSGDREERVALAGTVEQAAQLKPWLERKHPLGLRTVGVVCPQNWLLAAPGALPALSDDSPNPSPAGVLPFPILGTLDQVEEILKKFSISQLIILDLSLGTQWLRKLTGICEGAAVRLLTLHNLQIYFNHATTVFEDDGVRFISLREEPLESPLNRFFKRSLDLAVALPVVAFILPPATALVWLLQRFQSPGPVVFSQVRTGMMGRPFRMYKFRTMHPNNHNEAQQASKSDPRIYPAGHWLRKLSIDELPQFVNVLLGNMSVVGPRPHLPKHDQMFVRVMRTYFIRKFVQPGITGWAQVSGFRGEIHSETDIQQRVEADIYYLENWSFSMDCLIILKTLQNCIFPPRSAY